MDEFGIAQAQPVVNPTAEKIANFLRKAKEFGNQYEVKDYVPFFGGTGIGDLFLGQAPEEVNRWSYGDYPFRNPSSVVGTGGNRLDVWKTGRFEPTFDVVANVGLPAVSTAQITAKPLARALAPKAAEMAENYLTRTGAIANITEPSPVKMAEALRQPAKNELGFYSPLDEAVMNLQNPKGTGQQYLAQLLKTQGVKQEEVSTRGLDTFLTNNPKVSREQIAQYLRENPVTLKEKVLDENYNKVGTFDDYQLRGGEVIDDTAYMDDLANDEYFRIKSDESDLMSELRIKAYNDLDIDPATNDLSELNKIDDYIDNAVREQADQYARDVYYDNPYRSYYDDLGYEVTGNDDIGYYIKDPQGREVSTGRSGIYDISDVESRIREDALDRGLLTLNEEGPKYADYVLPNGENYREVLIQYPNVKSEKFDPSKVEIVRNRQSATQGTYTIKYNGKEMQTYGDEFNAKDNYKGLSDAEIMQTAKKLFEEGNKFQEIKPMSGDFRSGHFNEPNILAHMRVTDRTIDGKKTLFVEEIQSDWHQAGRKKGYFNQKAIDQNIEEQKQLVQMKTQALKDAEPYTEKGMDAPQEIIEKYTMADDRLNALRKQESQLKNAIPDAPFKKNWQELTMKRAMQMAAEGGYDRVAFTTGKQQADRYNLSKQVNSIDWKPYNERGATKLINIMPKNGNLIELPINADGKVIERIGGQFAGKSIDEIIGKEVAKKIMETPDGDLTGQGLEIGGEGMKGFYDKILPDFINKYGKKHGLKVGQTNLSKNWKGEDLFDYLEKQGMTMKEYDALSKEQQNALLKKAGDEVHYFDLNPEAKESFLKKGQPLFAVPPAMAITDEDSRRDVLEKLFNNQK